MTDADPVDEFVASIDQVVGRHEAMGAWARASADQIIPREQLADLQAIARRQRSWAIAARGRFAGRLQREAELYAILLLEIEQQLGRILDDLRQGRLPRPGAGGPESRQAAAVLGLRDQRDRLRGKRPD